MGALLYDHQTRTLTGPLGERIASPTGDRILLCLMAHTGKVVRHDTLIGAVWPNPTDEPEGAEDTLRQHIWRIRQNMRAVGSKTKIVSRWGTGYMLVEVQS